MRLKIALLLLSISVLYVEVDCQCGPIGTNNETEFTAVRDLKFYLNTAHPAPCSGTVTGWRYCFYRPNTSGGNRYRATWAVYRRMGSDGNTRYTIVASSQRSVTLRNGDVDSDFRCLYRGINTDFDIEVGDIVGACIYDPNDSLGRNVYRKQLDIVGQDNGYSLAQLDDVDCANSFPSDISSSRLSVANSRILHLYANIIDPTFIPTTSLPTTIMSTIEQTTSVTWSMSVPSDTTTIDMNTHIPTTSPPTTTMSTTEEAISVTWSTTIPSDTTTMDVTTTALDVDTSTTMMTSSSTAEPTTQTASDTPESTNMMFNITTQTAATSESTSTTGSIVSTTSPTEVGESTTISENETISIAQTTLVVTNALSTNENGDGITSAATRDSDTTTIVPTKDDATSTAAQFSAPKDGTPGLEVIIGATVAVALIVVTGIAVIIIMIVIFKRHGKNVGMYSSHNKIPQSTATVKITPNGVDNLTYDVGFHNPGTLDTSFSLYDDVRNPLPESMGEGNYYQLAESTFSNTYESVTATRIYSELSAVQTSDTQINVDQNPSGGISSHEMEYYYSSPEDSKECLSFLLERNKQEDIYGNLDAYYAPASNEDEIYSQLQSCGTNNIPHNQIRIIGHLGSGQFGNVEKGTWRSKEVALKTLKTGSTEEDKVKFLQEAAIMAQFEHPNIIKLHGIVSDEEPLMLVGELMHKGDLRDHLHSIRPDPGELPMANLPAMLLSFSQHVALGMQYLSGKGFVHRDLAARNILVSKDNICKVADFGMSRDLADETYYVSHGGMIPVKWTAPEAIHYKKYSTASDVWSYGCLLYEIWSLGYKPFEGITNIEVVKIIDTNRRLSPPPGCPRMIYELMIKCWDPLPGSRPRFRDLAIVLTGNYQDVLSIPQKALDVHKLAGVLGSPLEFGKNMYRDLQNMFC